MGSLRIASTSVAENSSTCRIHIPHAPSVIKQGFVERPSTAEGMGMRNLTHPMAGLQLLRSGSWRMQNVKVPLSGYRYETHNPGAAANAGGSHHLSLLSESKPSAATASNCISRRRSGRRSSIGHVVGVVIPRMQTSVHLRSSTVVTQTDAATAEGPHDDFVGEETSGAAIGVGEHERYVVVNFYHFVELQDPQAEVARHSAFVQSREIRGRIYINHQGINAQLSGPSEEALAYAHWVKEDVRFSEMYLQVSPSPQGHAFPRLKLRYKPCLVQVEGGTARLPLNESGARAVSLTPSEWLEKLERSERPDLDNGERRKTLLLDVRNGYEWDVGHFKGAQRPQVDNFKETDFGLSECKSSAGDPLVGVDKEEVDVLMYCTGGIRCDVYSTILRQKGFKNLFTLKGGVARYLKEVGRSNWSGNLFVFDSRLAVEPRAYALHSEANSESVFESPSSEDCPTCRLCGGRLPQARHRNCANVECNELFLACEQCESRQKGCCSLECLASPKLRPLLDGSQAYERWHNYRDDQVKATKLPGHESSRALRRRLRREKRQQLDKLNTI